MKKKLWVLGYLAIVLAALAFIAVKVIDVDPYFHYHKPKTDQYFYTLSKERSINNGMTKNFEYEGIITGTSMTENFKTSEAENLFDERFIKVTYSGGSFNEINENLKVAAENNPDLKTVIRSLDMNFYFDDKDLWRTDMGEYPMYLYDNNPFNDVQYVFNRYVLFSQVYQMIRASKKPGFEPGITSFDTYANWMAKWKCGPKTLYPYGVLLNEHQPMKKMTQEDIDTVTANIRQNVTAIAEQYPDIDFYCFIPPYSAVWWKTAIEEGNFDRQVQAERIVVEECLKYDNIKLFSFNTLFDITTDLNQYIDDIHYAEWINSLILSYMKDGKCRLTRDNYERYLAEEEEFYSTFDFLEMNELEDYEDDYYAEALLRSRINGVQPHTIDITAPAAFIPSGAWVENDQYYGMPGLICLGRLERTTDSDMDIDEYMRDVDFVGVKIPLEDISQYKYLVFYGRKRNGEGQPTVRIYDADGNVIAGIEANYRDLDYDWHRYMIELDNIQGPVTLLLNGGYIDNSGSENSQYMFSNITFF